MASQQLFTALVTVFLELVWVLEANGCTPVEIQIGLTLRLGLPNFKPVHADIARAALAHFAQGMDFGNALHLALSSDDKAFMTFDKAFVRKAAKLAVGPRVMPA